MDFVSVVLMLAIGFGFTTVIAAVGALRGLGREAVARTRSQTHPAVLVMLDLGSAFLLGLGGILMAAVPALYRFIHGDRERYVWIISGPEPFGQFGGGPYQAWLYGSLLVAGLGAVVAGLALRRRLWAYLSPG